MSKQEMLKPKVSAVQRIEEQHIITKMQVITLPADGSEIYEAARKFLYEQVPFFHGCAEIIIAVRFPKPGSKYVLMAKGDPMVMYSASNDNKNSSEEKKQ